MLIKSAVCSHYGLAIGASFAPVIRVLVVFLLYPIARPVGMVRLLSSMPIFALAGAHDSR